jgi:hypothetical protein
MFDIRLIQSIPESRLGNAACEGEIVLGEQRENFTSLIGFWSPEDYLRHWRSEISRLVEIRQPSCLITSIYDPDEADVGTWWLLYPFGDVVVLQDSLLLFREMTGRFDTANPGDFIPSYKSRTEHGFDISEWEMPISDFVSYLKR